jgi:hypothetical protein
LTSGGSGVAMTWPAWVGGPAVRGSRAWGVEGARTAPQTQNIPAAAQQAPPRSAHRADGAGWRGAAGPAVGQDVQEAAGRLAWWGAGGAGVIVARPAACARQCLGGLPFNNSQAERGKVPHPPPPPPVRTAIPPASCVWSAPSPASAAGLGLARVSPTTVGPAPWEASSLPARRRRRVAPAGPCVPLVAFACRAGGAGGSSSVPLLATAAARKAASSGLLPNSALIWASVYGAGARRPPTMPTGVASGSTWLPSSSSTSCGARLCATVSGSGQARA